MGTPTRYPSGVSTQNVDRLLGNYPNPDPTKVYTNFEDFVHYTAGNWTVATGANAGAAAAAAGQGGLVTLTTAAVGTADYENLTTTPLDINFVAGQEVWFSTKMKLSVVTAPIALAGLVGSAPGATLTPTSGMYFVKPAGAATVDFVLRLASTSTTLSAVATLVADTFVNLGFYYNGKDEVSVFVNGTKVAGQTVLTNLPVGTNLGQALGVVNGAAVATVLTADWLMTSQARTAL
jgi:hypothetical protein